MSLAAGQRLAAYRIVARIGAGGMGEVYRARDTRLGREVALKVLPEAFTRDRMRLARFRREARLLASLNHPAIATLYDFEEIEGAPLLVMELVEGETLAERLLKGRMPVGEALPLFVQIAEALESAHAAGVVHRDLKPANVKITPQGRVKLLDFGLAKAVAGAPGQADLSQSPTLTANGSDTGVLLGTAPYMSPEQARGKAVDKKTDIWAFGCCLYEALAGRSAFRAETVSDTIVRVLEREPDWSRLPRDTPEGVRRLIQRCLRKEQTRRLQAIGDARLEIEEAQAQPEEASPAPRSIAVLPLIPLSMKAEDEYFADGTTEDIIAQLSKIRGLKVISRTSVMPFKKRELGLGEIAARLGVDTVLEGSVRRAGPRVRIVAQLIDAGTDQHLWTETYDRQLHDIFTIQSEVALQIATALKAELSPEEESRIRKEPTRSLEAYQLYLHGRQRFNRYTQDGIRDSIGFYERAIAVDPGYALAYTGLGMAYVLFGLGHGAGEIGPGEAYRRAKAAAARALELDETLGRAHAVLGIVRFVSDFEWSDAENELMRAMELDPADSYAVGGHGLLLSALTRYDEAVAAHRRARELDPLTPVHSSDLASTLLRAGRYDEALREARLLVELEPDFPMAHSTLGWGLLLAGECEAGLAALEKAVSLSSGNTILLAQLGQGLATAGQTERAREVLRRLEELSRERYVSPYHLAYVHTGLGEQDRAIDCLERAVEERAGGVYGIKGSFLFASLRGHPRFTALLRKMNLG